MITTGTYSDGSELTGDEQTWRDVLSGARSDVAHIVLSDGAAPQAEWRDGALWIYNDTLNGIDPIPIDGGNNL